MTDPITPPFTISPEKRRVTVSAGTTVATLAELFASPTLPRHARVTDAPGASYTEDGLSSLAFTFEWEDAQ